VNFERDDGDESTGEQTDGDFNDRETFGRPTKLRGSWQIETIEVAGM